MHLAQKTKFSKWVALSMKFIQSSQTCFFAFEHVSLQMYSMVFLLMHTYNIATISSCIVMCSHSGSLKKPCKFRSDSFLFYICFQMCVWWLNIFWFCTQHIEILVNCNKHDLFFTHPPPATRIQLSHTAWKQTKTRGVFLIGLLCYGCYTLLRSWSRNRHFTSQRARALERTPTSPRYVLLWLAIWTGRSGIFKTSASISSI